MILTAFCVGAAVSLLAVGSGIYLFARDRLSPERVGVLVFAAVGLSCLGVGLAVGWDRYQFARTAASAQGEVVDDGAGGRRNADGQWVTSHAPRVRFAAADGRVVEFVGPVVENGQGYPRGGRVEVLYPPGRPEDARLKAFDVLWVVAGGLVALGGTLAAIAARVLARGRTVPVATRRPPR